MVRIAAALGSKERAISAIYVQSKKGVEFRNPNGQTIATLIIHGEYGVAHTAYIIPNTLREEQEQPFMQTFVTLRVMFVELDDVPGSRVPKAA